MNSPQETLIDRPSYIRQLANWQTQTDLVKIITGARRCGKSKLLQLFQSHLQKNHHVQKDQIISINLEDALQTREIGLILDKEQFLSSYTTLLDYILTQLRPDKLNYVFIDEIQLLHNWQQVANTLRLRGNVDLYITGSNAYMFSNDLANSFGGRYVEIKAQPFSFKEYYHAYLKRPALPDHTVSDLATIYDHYIKEGGFPQTINFAFNQQMIHDYLLNSVYLNTVQKDIIKRFKLVDTGKLDSIIRYVFDTIGSETSLRKITQSLQAIGQNISVPTLTTYMQGLLDSYLLYKCDRYDIKGKKFLNSHSKYYVADIGLRTALLGRSDTDLGHILENIVYLELIRRGYRVSVGKVNTKTITQNGKSQRKTIEIDFIAQKSGGEREYYQVALYALDPEILKRELASLEEINDNYPKFLLSMDPGEGETRGIKRINVLQWLLK
ncbi:MAG: ATP-binding protein [Elusimicrobiaceae bacterium]|nr:ATP-binding protein [Elusimicrobiaceae bacterium]